MDALPARNADEAAAGILNATLNHLRGLPDMKRDISRLSSACCSPRKFELPQEAPQPALIAMARANDTQP